MVVDQLLPDRLVHPQQWVVLSFQVSGQVGESVGNLFDSNSIGYYLITRDSNSSLCGLVIPGGKPYPRTFLATLILVDSIGPSSLLLYIYNYYHKLLTSILSVIFV